MHWTSTFLSALAWYEVAQAHGGINIVGGRRGPAALQAKRGFAPIKPVSEAVTSERISLEARQTGNTDNKCGGDFGSCAEGFCCSSAGWCGNTPEYCNAPDCQINFGPGCDGNKKPAGVDTSDVPRPKNGEVPYGGLGIYDCVNDGDIAITFDDGPYIYTDAMLDKFKEHNASATFFITGTNIGKGMINDESKPWPAVMKRMVAEGHQIASHTWSHENSSQLSETQMRNQMIYNEIAFNDVLGFFPAYMRPPYSICESQCQTVLSDLGYHVTYFDLDTEGYLHTEPDRIQTSVGLWDKAMAAREPCSASYLHIEHDIHEQVATTLVDHILPSLAENGWRAVTVGTCLGDDPANWYRAGPSGSVPAYDFTNVAANPPTCNGTDGGQREPLQPGAVDLGKAVSGANQQQRPDDAVSGSGRLDGRLLRPGRDVSGLGVWGLLFAVWLLRR
ncbi:hypothetical protein ACHAQA_008140 [Verticillium albo-atrum]